MSGPTIQVSRATVDGNVSDMRRFWHLGLALKFVDRQTGTVFAHDLDNPERGELTELDLFNCGGKYV